MGEKRPGASGTVRRYVKIQVKQNKKNRSSIIIDSFSRDERDRRQSKNKNTPSVIIDLFSRDK